MAAAEAREAEPLRILLVAGQTGAGKSSLLNALANAVEAAVSAVPATASFTAYKLTHEGLPAALLIDSPGLAAPRTSMRWSRARRRLRHGAVGFVGQPGRARDRSRRRWRPFATILRPSTTAGGRRCCWCLPISTRLRPFSEWEPPYDLAAANATKSQSILGAMEAAGADLGFAADEIVPVRVDIALAPYNVDALWAKIIELVPEAHRARLLRTLSDIKKRLGLGGDLVAGRNAGRVISGTFLTRSTAQ